MLNTVINPTYRKSGKVLKVLNHESYTVLTEDNVLHNCFMSMKLMMMDIILSINDSVTVEFRQNDNVYPIIISYRKEN